jgi:hypothetical protein
MYKQKRVRYMVDEKKKVMFEEMKKKDPEVGNKKAAKSKKPMKYVNTRRRKK